MLWAKDILTGIVLVIFMVAAFLLAEAAAFIVPWVASW